MNGVVNWIPCTSFPVTFVASALHLRDFASDPSSLHQPPAMASLTLHAARSAVSESLSSPLLNALRVNRRRPLATKPLTNLIPLSSRAISSAPRRLATPSTSTYTRKPTVSQARAPTASSSNPSSASSPQTNTKSATPQSPIGDLSLGLADEPLILDENERQIDWQRSFHGLSAQPFSKEAADVLLAPISPDDIEVKPEGLIYLPEIKYRRILNKAFGPGGWGLAPRGETIVTGKSVTREYALVAHGRYVGPLSMSLVG